ncbi:MAG: hypothetical protein ACYC7A_15125 [Thermoanaerobaculia bacterium]
MLRTVGRIALVFATLGPASVFGQSFATLNLVRKVEITDAARPEIIVRDHRVFVLYLEPSVAGNAFRVMVYDENLSREITSKTLITTTVEYGRPTDIRVVADEGFVYAFYETATAAKTYLWGAKYALDDSFHEIENRGPIATSTIFTRAKPGDERLDDPAPMMAGDDVYVMTRYKSTLAAWGDTRFKLRRFDRDLNLLSEIVLDLSGYVDGEARQSSIMSEDGYYYIVTPTTTGDGNIIDTVEWTAPSDILMVKLNEQWDVVETKIIAQEDGYTEGDVTGLQSDRVYCYVTYCQVILGEEFSSTIKVFDKR